MLFFTVWVVLPGLATLCLAFVVVPAVTFCSFLLHLALCNAHILHLYCGWLLLHLVQ